MNEPLRKFIGKPVTVDAIIWTGDNYAQLYEFCNAMAFMRNEFLYIHTTEGESRAQIGDYIVRGTEGEFYPVKPQVMQNKYDEVNESN